MPRLTKTLGGLIGLGAEAYNSHKQAKERKATKEHQKQQTPRIAAQLGDHLGPPSPYSLYSPEEPDTDTESDEGDWARDETAAELPPPYRSHEHEHAKTEGDEHGNFAERFLRLHPLPSPEMLAHLQQLPSPIIIPQKRPKSRGRGFVRAYAPVLEGCAVDEAAFLEFLTGFEKVITKNGWFHVVNVAVALSVLAETVAFVPSAAVHAVAWVVHVGIEAGRRGFMSKKTNLYLDTLNENYFKPRGLYALIMTYDPTSTASSEEVDVNARLANTIGSHKSGGADGLHTGSGKTHTLEYASDEQKVNAFRKAGHFASDYYDRRAQAQFRSDHPGSSLSQQAAPEFESSLADPNHPAYQGGLLTLLSGGRRQGAKGRLSGIRGAREDNRGHASLMGKRKQLKDEGRTPLGFVKRQLHENVLYLMVVNMPSEEELQACAELQKKVNGRQ